mgnify:CR=1 FL=1
MKKILIIITTGFESTGGLTTVMMNYYRNIDKSNLIFDFASTNEVPEDLDNELTKNGSKYYNLGSKKKSPIGYMTRLFKLLINPKDDLFLNFNYTKTLENLYGCNNVCHIHGCIDNGEKLRICCLPINASFAIFSIYLFSIGANNETFLLL